MAKSAKFHQGTLKEIVGIWQPRCFQKFDPKWGRISGKISAAKSPQFLLESPDETLHFFGHPRGPLAEALRPSWAREGPRMDPSWSQWAQVGQRSTHFGHPSMLGLWPRTLFWAPLNVKTADFDAHPPRPQNGVPQPASFFSFLILKGENARDCGTPI